MLLKFIKIVWWLFLATIPIAISQVGGYLSMYNCPPTGDCYDLAALAKQKLESLYVITAIGIWPLCVWHLGARSIVQRLRRRKQLQEAP